MEEDKQMKKEEAMSASAPTDAMEIEIPTKFKQLIDQVKGLSVLDLYELVKTLEQVFGVSATTAVIVSGAGASGDASAAEEKSLFALEVKEAGAQKIAMIKVVKEVLGLGLKEAKDFVDNLPAVLKTDLNKEDAEALKKKIEEAGGKAELK